MTRAKYQAYQVPKQEILQNIDSSGIRARQWHKSEHLRISEEFRGIKTLLERRKGVLGAEEEKAALENSKKAMERMRDKVKRIQQARVN